LLKNGYPPKIDGIYLILNGKATVKDIFGLNIASLNVGDIFGEGLLVETQVSFFFSFH